MLYKACRSPVFPASSGQARPHGPVRRHPGPETRPAYGPGRLKGLASEGGYLFRRAPTAQSAKAYRRTATSCLKNGYKATTLHGRLVFFRKK